MNEHDRYQPSPERMERTARRFESRIVEGITAAQTERREIDHLPARSQTLARLITASLHDGAGTALERFTSSGQFDAEEALHELNTVRVPLEQEGWVDALGRYVLLTAGGRS